MAKGQKTGGRKAGVPNKSTAQIKELAGQYGAPAIKRLAELGGLVKGKPPAEAEAVQKAALSELLDRGFGKATQPIDHGSSALEDLLERLAGQD